MPRREMNATERPAGNAVSEIRIHTIFEQLGVPLAARQLVFTLIERNGQTQTFVTSKGDLSRPKGSSRPTGKSTIKNRIDALERWQQASGIEFVRRVKIGGRKPEDGRMINYPTEWQWVRLWPWLQAFSTGDRPALEAAERELFEAVPQAVEPPPKPKIRNQRGRKVAAARTFIFKEIELLIPSGEDWRVWLRDFVNRVEAEGALAERRFLDEFENREMLERLDRLLLPRDQAPSQEGGGQLSHTLNHQYPKHSGGLMN